MRYKPSPRWAHRLPADWRALVEQVGSNAAGFRKYFPVSRQTSEVHSAHFDTWRCPYPGFDVYTVQTWHKLHSDWILDGQFDGDIGSSRWGDLRLTRAPPREPMASFTTQPLICKPVVQMRNLLLIPGSKCQKLEGRYRAVSVALSSSPITLVLQSHWNIWRRVRDFNL